MNPTVIHKFNDDFVAKERLTIIDANSFIEHSKEHLNHIYKLLSNKDSFIIGEKELVLKKLESKDKIYTFNENDMTVYVSFSEDLDIPILRETHSENVWMSHTPMEVYTCNKGIALANGNVLMGGLGLGYMAKRVLEKENVSHLTIYEIDEELINTVGECFKEEYQDKITIVKESIYSIKDDSMYDSVLIDIYPTFSDFINDDDLRDTFPSFDDNSIKYWAWGSCSEDAHIEFIIKDLRGTHQHFDETNYTRRGFDEDKLYREIDNEIFQCSCCSWWCDISECNNVDDENVCNDCLDE